MQLLTHVLDGTNADSDDENDNIVQESDGSSRITMDCQIVMMYYYLRMNGLLN